jgi:hypothetical protein
LDSIISSVLFEFVRTLLEMSVTPLTGKETSEEMLLAI